MVGSGIHAPLPDWGDDAEPGERVPFSFELVLRGSGELSFLPAGEETRVEMSSPWPSPGFGGAFLPAERDVRPDGFTASWRVPYFGRDYGQIWADLAVDRGQLSDSTFGVSLVLPADAYQQTERSVKCAVLFILLTFGSGGPSRAGALRERSPTGRHAAPSRAAYTPPDRTAGRGGSRTPR